MKEVVRFGMIGCGMIANFHAHAIEQAANGQLTACYDAYKPGAQEFGRSHGIQSFDCLLYTSRCV